MGRAPVVCEAEVRDARACEPVGQQARLVILQQVAAQVEARQVWRARQRLHRLHLTGCAAMQRVRWTLRGLEKSLSRA